MEFHLPLIPPPAPVRIGLRDPILLAGSCFPEHTPDRLRAHRFQVLDNPHGILFNPHSLSASLLRAIKPIPYTKEDLFHHEGLWGSWDFHTRFSDPDPLHVLEKMNRSMGQANAFLPSCRWVILTLGSAYVYQLADGRIVANCHKVPAQHFSRTLLSIQQILDNMSNLIDEMAASYPEVRILLTVSPVRHLRDGFVENNRSKAHLIAATHLLCEQYAHVTYFPAYELVIDDLRDHRFYMEDMVHPNHLATEYVWERFVASLIEPASREAMKAIAQLNAAMAHRPLHPTSSPHVAFRKRCHSLAIDLSHRHPYIDFSDAIHFFS